MYVYTDPYTAVGCVCTCAWIHTQQCVVYVYIHMLLYTMLYCQTHPSGAGTIVNITHRG